MKLPAYDAKHIEASQAQNWNKANTYAWDENTTRDESYVIDTPPPTVSGVLHMGHIFSYTQADFVARYQRMKGKNVFYPMGFDDNGLPTERLVEKTKKVKAHQVIKEQGREAFIALCQSVVDDSLKQFRGLFEAVGLSVDWNQQYDTINPEVVKLSQMSFLDLVNKGHVERRMQPMLWDPVDQTAIAQAEVEDKEEASHMNHVTFFIDEIRKPNNMREEVTIATTRPELLAACVAVFYHPDDARYKHLEGKTAVTPLFGVKVPFLADEMVQPDKGTGLVMCCTFGDETDIHWWKTHKLPMRLVLNKYGKLCNLEHVGKTHPDTGEAWKSITHEVRLKNFADMLNGKKATDARMLMIAQLQEYGLLVKQDAITHSVKIAERSGATLELLPTPQWFVKLLDKKEALKQRNRECAWHPTFMSVRMEQWIDGLKWDWCISRQRFFGVPFPVWYSKRPGEEGKPIYAHPDDLPVNPLISLPRGYKADEVDADPDVMDTWATSSISPQISSKGITDKLCVDAKRHKKLFPADLRPQAHEIIRTWAFYTMVKAHLHEETIPWKNLMISGWCLASDKSKMSKSKGNVVEPLDLLKQHGADAVRYWASTSRLGADTAYTEDTVKVGRRLVTKLWNAAQFAAMHFEKAEDHSSLAEDISRITHATDRWMLGKLSETLKAATRAFEEYEYADARQKIEDCFWKDWCDNYLELCKARIYAEEDSDDRRSAALTLRHGTRLFLLLFAPFVPFVTDELFSHLYAADYLKHGSIHHRGSWPEAFDIASEALLNAGDDVVAMLAAIRKLKAEKNLSVKYPLTAVQVESLPQGIPSQALEELMADMLGAANAPAYTSGKPSAKASSMALEGNKGAIGVEFAASSEAA